MGSAGYKSRLGRVGGLGEKFGGGSNLGDFILDFGGQRGLARVTSGEVGRGQGSGRARGCARPLHGDGRTAVSLFGRPPFSRASILSILTTLDHLLSRLTTPLH